jgi:Nif-specific regulatory protein
VRELENCVRRAATLTHGDVIRREDLSCAVGECLSSQLWAGGTHGAFSDPIGELASGRTIAVPAYERTRPPAPPQPAPVAPLDEAAAAKACEHAETGDCPAITSRLTEKERLIDAMERAGWVQAKAARILGITPRQIGYALRKYRIEMKRL